MTATDERPSAEIGNARARREDHHLITGRTSWSDNLQAAGLLHLAFVRSPMAHGKILSINTDAAKEVPGVAAVITGKDIAEVQGDVPCAWPVTPDMVNPGAPPMAVDQVNHVGEAIAVVAARTKAAAVDAAELIEVDIDPLPPVLDMEEAVKDGAELVHPNTESNTSYTWVFDSAEAGTGGNAGEAIDSGEVVVKRRFIQQRLAPAFMEPRSVIAEPVDDGGIKITTSTQIPHILRVMIAMTLGIPEQKVRVIAPDVGGGFGGKIPVTPEEMIAVIVAQRIGRPVKFTETRSESLLTAHHGRDQIQDVTISATKDGQVTGLDIELHADMGAYLRLVGPGVPVLGAFMFPAIYKIPAYKFTCHGVFTTKTPTDAYRGAGRPEATYAIERIMDELAVELDMDPMELRRKNWIKHEEFPFTTVCGLTYDTGNYEAATDKALEMIGWDELKAERDKRRADKSTKQLGLGISTFTEMCGLAPSRVLGSLDYGAGGWEYASIRMLPTGKVEATTGTSPHGQGLETSFAQILSDQLGVPYDDISILHGDTQSSHKGLDTYGSRSLSVGGIALVKAADKVKEKAKKMAEFLLEASADDIEFDAGRFAVKGTDKGISIQEIALAEFAGHNYPEGMELGLDSDATYDPENFSFPHGTHLAAVEVDTDTGDARLVKYACVDDIGNVINPLIVDGQIHGGLAQGIAQALYEEVIFDEDGNLTTGTFVDYTLPSAADLPSFLTGQNTTAATSNPLGVKGVGEAGCIASTPAVMNAVVDAVRQYGVNDIRMPASPERVWRAIHEQDGKTQTAAEETTAHTDGTSGN
ncbi:molybdopterin-dependent oxidoreductase [Epidermidibacterium keratini]|uniref:Molybdopterin-dependent oxidoreductase n=1 Tax=Epidermidibacterium keratini TaxID=1891644 RepID=A0A7L4YMV3_9ACTN|nr:xanthine dehydrogenase family protein molybdopterin-binding subunit [Epidermidibacterium keratini]QHC00213.1 molybdopterin-dependent oxidoreductase [Epidermidibacterium keratini]